MERLAEHFELILFTASNKFYAKEIIKLIDPKQTLISYALFREHCYRTEHNLYIKDLRILNRDLKSILIVDNSVISFAFQLDNGIPILPFYDSMNDEELVKVTNHIMALKDLKDVRAGNREGFGLQQMYNLNAARFLRYYEEEPVKVCNVDNELDKLKISLPTYLAKVR